MSSWMEGYASTDNYTKHYFRELNPNYAAFALLCAGIRPPKIKNACELGFGFGMSINQHASTQNINWYGNDYNPTQKNYAQHISNEARNGAVLTDESFAQLVEKSHWPKFDYISLHGIWSWMSVENQSKILKFIANHLSDNGVVYISYNVSPGSTAFLPIRDLMKHKYEFGTNKGETLEKRMEETLNYLYELKATGGNYLKNSPLAGKRLDDLKDKGASYLLHEYLNKDWNIESFLSMKEKLNEIKLGFCCSANFQSSLSALNYSEKQSDFLKQIIDPAEREYISDLYWAETFRKDYWAKGPSLLSKQERWDSLSKFRVIQSKPKEDVPKEFTGKAFKGSIENEIYHTVMNLIEEKETISLEEIAGHIKENSREAAIQSVRILLSLGYINLVINENYITKAKEQSFASSINGILCKESLKSENAVTYLCSNKSGEALPLTRSTLIYLHARDNGYETFSDACLAVVRLCAENSEVFQKDGKVLTNEKDAHDFIMKEVKDVIEKYSKILAKHGIELKV